MSFVPGNVYVVTSTQCDSWPGCRAEHNKGLTGLMPPPRVWRHSGYGWCCDVFRRANAHGDDAAPPLPAATVRASAVDNPRNPNPTVGHATPQARFSVCLPARLNFVDKAEFIHSSTRF